MKVRRLGPETERSHKKRFINGFYKTYMNGKGLDIGYRGSVKGRIDAVLPTAIGIDIDYPGYDGITLPFNSESQDYVFSSHCLEHIDDPFQAIQEWWRVLKVGGYLVVTVPHKHLYERKEYPPSIWNGDHKRFYTPCSLLYEIEQSLPVNGYRIAHMRDNDDNFDYDRETSEHASGAYEIELVVKKLPTWKGKLIK